MSDSESVRLVKAHIDTSGNSRLGAVCRKSVWQTGCARYRVREPVWEFRWYRGKVIFRPELTAQGVFS